MGKLWKGCRKYAVGSPCPSDIETGIEWNSFSASPPTPFSFARRSGKEDFVRVPLAPPLPYLLYLPLSSLLLLYYTSSHSPGFRSSLLRFESFFRGIGVLVRQGNWPVAPHRDLTAMRPWRLVLSSGCHLLSPRVVRLFQEISSFLLVCTFRQIRILCHGLKCQGIADIFQFYNTSVALIIRG